MFTKVIVVVDHDVNIHITVRWFGRRSVALDLSETCIFLGPGGYTGSCGAERTSGEDGDRRNAQVAIRRIYTAVARLRF